MSDSETWYIVGPDNKPVSTYKGTLEAIQDIVGPFHVVVGRMIRVYAPKPRPYQDRRKGDNDNAKV